MLTSFLGIVFYCPLKSDFVAGIKQDFRLDPGKKQVNFFLDIISVQRFLHPFWTAEENLQGK